MEIRRFINGQPVSAVPPMLLANEGVVQILRQARSQGAPVRPRPARKGPERPSSAG